MVLLLYNTTSYTVDIRNTSYAYHDVWLCILWRMERKKTLLLCTGLQCERESAGRRTLWRISMHTRNDDVHHSRLANDFLSEMMMSRWQWCAIWEIVYAYGTTWNMVSIQGRVQNGNGYAYGGMFNIPRTLARQYECLVGNRLHVSVWNLGNGIRSANR